MFPSMATVAAMDAFEAITSHRQVRSFTDTPIPDEQLHQILEAARRAPSARNGQPWNFIVVTDSAARQDLSRVWAGAGWMASAPVIVAIVLPGAAGEAAHFYRFDMGQAAMQMMIAATGLDIGSGQAHAEDQELARRVLGFPEGHHCARLIAFGYPSDRPLRPIKNPTRRPFDDVVGFGTW